MPQINAVLPKEPIEKCNRNFEHEMAIERSYIGQFLVINPVSRRDKWLKAFTCFIRIKIFSRIIGMAFHFCHHKFESPAF